MIGADAREPVGKAIPIASDVVGCPCIRVPHIFGRGVCVCRVGRGRKGRLKCFFKPMIAIECIVHCGVVGKGCLSLEKPRVERAAHELDCGHDPGHDPIVGGGGARERNGSTTAMVLRAACSRCNIGRWSGGPQVQ